MRKGFSSYLVPCEPSHWEKGNEIAFSVAFCFSECLAVFIPFPLLYRFTSCFLFFSHIVSLNLHFLYFRLPVGHAPHVPAEKPITLGEYLKQLSRHRNFLWFVSMNLVQVNIFTDPVVCTFITGCDHTQSNCWTSLCHPFCRYFTATLTAISSLYSWSISYQTRSLPPLVPFCWVRAILYSCSIKA